MIATFVFIFTLLNLGNFTQGLKPLIVGFLIMVVGQALGSTTGFALNPARDFSPRLAYAILPVPNKGGANWAYAWVPVLGPIAGGLLASGLQALLMLTSQDFTTQCLRSLLLRLFSKFKIIFFEL